MIFNREKSRMIFLITLICTLFVFLVMILISDSQAYYTNVHKYFQNSNTYDGSGGYGLSKNSNEFIIDGCGYGTILDTLTGFCWDKNLTRSGTLRWANSTAYSQPTWNNVTKVYSYPSGKGNYPAFAYCEDLVIGTNTEFRVSSRTEMHTLVNQIVNSSMTCATLEGYGFIGCSNSVFWTNRVNLGVAGTAWTFNLQYSSDTYISYPARTGSYYVLCVQ